MLHTEEHTVLRLTAAGLVAVAGVPGGRLLAADSWLVADGAARAQDAHWARFAGACMEHGVAIDGFRAPAAAAIPAAGRWFPRVELREGGALALCVRAAPPRAATASVCVAPPGDPRTCPRRKGPDLDLLVALRAGAPADEVLLRDADGMLLEGALSSLLWWEGDVLCTTPLHATLPGVTRALLLAIAAARGVEVRVRAPRAAELAGREVWLASALHGIRAVTAWVDPVQPAGLPRRAPAWQEELERGG